MSNRGYFGSPICIGNALLAFSGQRKLAFDAGFNDALFGRPKDNPYDINVVGGSYAAYEEGYELGLISDVPPRGPQGEQGDTGPAGGTGASGVDGTDGANGTTLYVGSGAPGGGLGLDGDQYIDSDNGDIYTKVTGSWNLVGNIQAVAQTTRSDTIDPEVFPEVTYRGDGLPGAVESAASWRVTRLTMQSDGDTEVLFADGNDNYDNIWDNRLSLTYS